MEVCNHLLNSHNLFFSNIFLVLGLAFTNLETGIVIGAEVVPLPSGTLNKKRKEPSSEVRILRNAKKRKLSKVNKHT